MIPQNEVHLWQQPLLVALEQWMDYKKLLSADEVVKAERYVYSKDQRRYVVARATLRQIIARYHQTLPADILFSYNEHGKPAINQQNSTLHFNLSHSAEIAVYALSSTYSVGIDIEKMREDIETLDIAKRFFAENESKALYALPSSQRLAAFYRCWTRKEAFLKALGQGLSFPLNQCEVTLTPDEPAQILTIYGDSKLAQTWQVYSFELPLDYMGAVVVHGKVDEFKWIT